MCVRRVETIYERARKSTNRGADELAPELGLWSGSEEMARLQVLHQIPALKGTSLGLAVTAVRDEAETGAGERAGYSPQHQPQG